MPNNPLSSKNERCMLPAPAPNASLSLAGPSLVSNLYNPGAAALASSPRVCHQATASPQSEVPPVPPASRVRTKCADSDALSFMSFAALSTLTKVLSTEFLMLSRLV